MMVRTGIAPIGAHCSPVSVEKRLIVRETVCSSEILISDSFLIEGLQELARSLGSTMPIRAALEVEGGRPENRSGPRGWKFPRRVHVCRDDIKRNSLMYNVEVPGVIAEIKVDQICSGHQG